MLMLAFLITSALMITSTLMAQKAVTPPMAQETITELMSKDLAGFPGKEVLMYTVDFPPGFSSPVHRHNAQVSVYMLEGSVVMQVRGGKEVTLRPGQSFYEDPNDIHVVSRNASSTKSAKIPCVPDSQERRSAGDTSKVNQQLRAVLFAKTQFRRKYMSTITVKDSKFASYATVLLRIGIGVGFLSAVADRFGLWECLGNRMSTGGISHGSHRLNWYLPAGMIPPLGSSPLALKSSSVFFSSSAGTHAPPRC